MSRQVGLRAAGAIRRAKRELSRGRPRSAARMRRASCLGRGGWYLADGGWCLAGRDSCLAGSHPANEPQCGEKLEIMWIQAQMLELQGIAALYVRGRTARRPGAPPDAPPSNTHPPATR